MVQQLIVHFLLLTYTHEQFHRDKPYFTGLRDILTWLLFPEGNWTLRWCSSSSSTFYFWCMPISSFTVTNLIFFFVLSFFLSFLTCFSPAHMSVFGHAEREWEETVGLTASRIELDIVRVQRCSSSWPTVRSLTYTPEQFDCDKPLLLFFLSCLVCFFACV